MGSTPISPTNLVVDTSPLQALHRCRALEVLEAAYSSITVSAAVSEETRRSLASTGETLVPDLGKYPFIRVAEPIPDEELFDLGAVAIGPYRSTHRFRFSGRQIERPELEVVVLAERAKATALMEDTDGVECARARQVATLGVAQVLRDLERWKFIADAPEQAKKILATGYFSLDLRALSHGYRNAVKG